MKKIFLTAEWRKLIMFNYSVDPSILTPYLPYKTELDFYKDKCYVSLVGFGFINTRLKGFAIPFHRDFEEINLRFYVRYNDDGVWKRGVTFIKEIVPKRALTMVANSIYNEKYVTLPTRRHWIKNTDSMNVSYQWKHQGDWDFVEVKALSTASMIMPESEEEFITEHYWGYTQLDDRMTSEYQVEHPRWLVYPILHHTIQVRFGSLYGAEFGTLKDAIPDSIVLAEGSEISVRSAKIIR
ncbi:MAG: DUF2071 domain-containing protein [Chitinophagaceae bacterium]|nr:DUF2071 domain-containing protein [Chitinophagaceae bacterium]